MSGISVMACVQNGRFGNSLSGRNIYQITDSRVQDKYIVLTRQQNRQQNKSACLSRSDNNAGLEACPVDEKMVDSPVSRSAEDRSKKQAAKTVRTASKNHIDSGKERRRGRTASRKSALFLRALVLAFVFTGMIAGFGLMTRASSTGKQEKYKYYDTVTIGYGEDLTDIVDTYCDKGEYESSDAYIREICQINSLPYQKGAVPDLGVGTKIVIPYYSTVLK